MRLVKLTSSSSVLLVSLISCVVSYRKTGNQDVHRHELLNSLASVQLPVAPIYFGQYPANAMLARGQHLPVNSNQEDAFYSIGYQNNEANALDGHSMSEPMLLQSLGLDLAKPVATNQPKQTFSSVSSSLKKAQVSSKQPLVVSSLGAPVSGPKLRPHQTNKLLKSYNPLKSLTIHQQPPTQTLVSTRASSGNSNPVKSSTRLVKASQIEELLRQLRPLSSGHIDPDDNVNDLDSEDIQQLRREKKLRRVLPTSHLFGGSLGVVNESLLDDGDRGESSDLFSADLSDDRELDALLSGIVQKPSSTESARDNVIDLNRLSDTDSLPRASSNLESELRNSPGHVVASNPVVAQSSIPIDLLVDHLMSNSRLATFDAQHRLREPLSNLDSAGESVEFDDDDDEEADDDQDNNDTLPSDSYSSESTTHETRVEAPKESASVTFSSVANRTDSWVPLNSIEALQPNQSAPNRVYPEHKRHNRRKRRDGLNLVVGDKVLSRLDLIRLIRILNRMASKREPSAEREAARKLLRFLVKLALDEHRKSRYNTFTDHSSNRNSPHRGSKEGNKSASDPIWDFFRSIVVSPVSESERDNTSTTDKDPIELLPVQIPPRQRSAESGQSSSSSAPPIVARTKLDKLSDDLEQYFDNDFYEDLADRTAARNNGSDGTWIQHRRELRAFPRRLKPERARRPGYRLPVPVYGRKDLDAADEDDVELDHVRLKKSAGRRRRDRGKQQARSVGRRRDRTVRKRVPAEADDQSDKDDEPDSDESDNDEQPVKSKDHGNEVDLEKLNDAERGSYRGDRKQDDESLLDDDEQRADEDQEVNNANRSEPITATSNGDDTDPSEEGRESNKRRKRRKRRRKKIRTDVDLDSRDEIPAPIVAGRLASQSAADNDTRFTDDMDISTLEGSVTGSRKDEQPMVKRKKQKKIASKKLAKRDKPRGVEGKKVATGSSKKSIALSKNKKPHSKGVKDEKKGRRMKPKHRKKELQVLGEKGSPKRKARSSPRRTGRKKKVLETEEELEEEPQDMGDLDYYQEGTSYSRICDDNGKCKVKLESSSPKLGKAIKTGDKPMIERHLGQWMSEPD